MGFPKNNLPSLNGQRNYMLVQETSNSPAEKAIKQCEDEQVDQYRGFALSILRAPTEDIQAMIKYYDYVTCYDSKDHKAWVLMTTEKSNMTSTDITLSQEIVQQAMYYSVNPIARANKVHDLLQLIGAHRAQHSTTPDLSVTRAQLIQHMFDKKENEFNHIDKLHVRIMLTQRNTALATSESLHSYINSTYVNIVYDSDDSTVCSQSVLSDSNEFMSLQDVERYGLLCTHMLIESEQPQKTTMSMYTTHSTRQHTSFLPTYTPAYTENSTITQYVHTENSTIMPTHVVNSTIKACKPQECTNTLSISMLAIGAALTIGNIVTMFIAFNNSTCAAGIRARLSVIKDTICSCAPNISAYTDNVVATARAVRQVPKHIREARAEEMRMMEQHRQDEAQTEFDCTSVEIASSLHRSSSESDGDHIYENLDEDLSHQDGARNTRI